MANRNATTPNIVSARPPGRLDVQRLKAEEHPSWTFHDYFCRRVYKGKNECQLLREILRSSGPSFDPYAKQ